MVQQTSKDYKLKLHQRKVSHNAPSGDNQQPEGNQQVNNPIVEEVNTKDLGIQVGDKLEIPVVSMSDFEVVDIKYKLNLLMSVISNYRSVTANSKKVNPRFHLIQAFC